MRTPGNTGSQECLRPDDLLWTNHLANAENPSNTVLEALDLNANGLVRQLKRSARHL